MTIHFKTYIDVFYVYFTTENSPILKTLGQFENLGFVIMSTRENIRLIARAPLSLIDPVTSEEKMFWLCSRMNNGRLFVCLFVCLFDLILYFQSTIFQLNRDGSSWVEPVLS